MAIWQFNIILIPHNKEILKLPIDELSENTIQKIWENRKLEKTNIEIEIDNILNKENYTGNNLNWKKAKYNDSDHDVFIGLNNSQEIITDFSLRIDIRDNSKIFIKTIIEMIKKFDLLCLTNITKELIPPTEEEFNNAINKSDAAKFCNNPLGFIKEIAEKRALTTISS